MPVAEFLAFAADPASVPLRNTWEGCFGPSPANLSAWAYEEGVASADMQPLFRHRSHQGSPELEGLATEISMELLAEELVAEDKEKRRLEVSRIRRSGTAEMMRAAGAAAAIAALAVPAAICIACRGRTRFASFHKKA
eukprot:gnl/TRDRNA2_/TRDRNA2_162103_c1_seq1.p1 gnl/TRDRNA2_/TRDRNA2_162103_c1~~gnl/TRDRNA2_/TRDRNA2_162103_c1_seq1.p1  ORF type:complete len:149 (+),score=31.85 gnl/TRDRNA2_/TRDRNA2_162103_c1_seq1:35-448(+)